MQRRPLYFALAAAIGLLASTPLLAQTSTSEAEINLLKNLVAKQQQQLDQQQRDLQSLRGSIRKLEGEQSQQQAQLEPRPDASASISATAVPATSAVANAPAAPAFTSTPGLSLAFHGFISATAFSQSRNYSFGNGQFSVYPTPGPGGRLSGFDIRNTRFLVDLTGAKVAGNWTGGARLELDFFGGYTGTGPYAQQQPLPRLRQAYMVLSNPTTGSTIKIGQQWDLLFPLDNLPESLSHIAFPLGFGAGIIGWRFPGIVWQQDLNHGATGPAWQLSTGVFEGTWNGPGSPTNYQSAGNAGFRPQLEAKIRVEQKGQWMLFAAAHYSQVDLAGVGGREPTPVKRKFSSTAYEVGGNWTPGQWIVKGMAYHGRGIPQIFGGLSQFGDIADTGGYGSVGYRFTPNWSANATYASSKPNTRDVKTWLGHGATGLLKSRQVAGNIQYSVGDYAFALEWIHHLLDSTTTGVNRVSTTGNQIDLSAYYKF